VLRAGGVRVVGQACIAAGVQEKRLEASWICGGCYALAGAVYKPGLIVSIDNAQFQTSVFFVVEKKNTVSKCHDTTIHSIIYITPDNILVWRQSISNHNI
jgi:hypothetical protein